MSLAVLCATEAVAADLTRDKVPVDETWNLADLYRDDAAWKQAKDACAKRIPELKKLETGFGKSAPDLLKALTAIDDARKELERVEIYANLKSDQDTRDAQTLALKQELDVVDSDFAAATAWLNPAVLKLGRAKIDEYLKQEKGLAVYRQPLDDMLRRAPHTLTPGEEKIIADSGLIADSAYNIYSILSNADIKFPTTKLASGEKVELTQAAYTKYRESANRDDRIKVFKTFWQVFKDYSRTFGVSLDANVKRDLFYARARKYNSALESALDDNNIPVAVYKNLIADIHKSLPTLHRYLKLRARLLGIDQLAYHDLYPPLVKAVELKYSYADGKKLVLEGLAPLGPEYQQALATALNSRWIDVHPTKGKQSGAYSVGDAYDVHPYILLNFNGGYDDVSAVAHEIGHTMHSYFSNKNQPYATSDYPIFLAEVASTTNEALLIRHMLKKEKDPKVRLYLLGSYLEGMRTTIFRQTMFAEFELMIHEAAEKGEALTNENLAQMYGKLLREYHGQDQGVCQIDDLYTYEWAYIPHFYRNFYVFQYATGMVAATALSQRVLNGGQQERDDYLAFIKAGSSRYAIDILKSAGVDLTTSAPFEAAMKVMNEIMDEIEAIDKAAPATKGKAKGAPAKDAKTK